MTKSERCGLGLTACVAMLALILSLLAFVNGGPGSRGVSVVAAHIDSDGDLVLMFSDSQLVNLGRVVGRDGKDGLNGITIIGPQGERGPQGPTGPRGFRGKSCD